MKRLLYLLLVIIVTGCQKDPGRSSFYKNDTPAPQPERPSPLPYTPITFPEDAQFYLLAGQSNMSGELCSPPFSPDPNVSLYGYPEGSRGEGYAFGLTMNYRTNKPIVLIRCAVGGTSMAQQQGLFNTCLNFVKQNNIQKVNGLIFAQGEQDATFNYQSNWGMQFETYVNNVRLSLNSPNLPVVFTQIGQYGDNNPPPEYEYIKDQQESIMLPNVNMVKTDDITPTCGGWHYCRDEAEIIGDRLAASMLHIN